MPVANVHGAGAPALIDPRETPYRWLVLALAAITNTLVVAAPSMAMPVLFAEISADLKLSLVQVGVIWGISSLPAILTGLLGGSIGDRFGPRKVILIGCLLSAVFGGLRGFSNNFATLLVGMFLLGMVSPLVVMNNLKMSGMWFTSRQLGLASGFLSMGMALGF
ncbi:MAG: MFS transporter, partial [Anaerolineae bacterium]|nr:MFS transporter [Anaerolineae bacterium]